MRTIDANMPCPFLSRLPGSFIKNYAPPLLKLYADQCPVLSRAVSINKGSQYQQEVASAFADIATSDGMVGSTSMSGNVTALNNKMKCPFLNEVGKDSANQLVKAAPRHDIFQEGSKS